MNRILTLTMLLLGWCCATSLWAADTLPEWIWLAKQRNANEAIILRKQFTVSPQLRRAHCVAVADYCQGSLFINGQVVAQHDPLTAPIKVDLTPSLLEGQNTVSVSCRSMNGPAAVMVRIELEYADGSRHVVVTNDKWQGAKREPYVAAQWPEEKQISWQAVVSQGTVVAHRWGLEPETIAISSVDDYTQWKRAVGGEEATDPKTFQVAAGFKVERIHSATKEEDSWVSLTGDDRGRWIIGMEKKGLLRLTLPKLSSAVPQVERVNDSLRECRGLVFAHDALYAMANNDHSLFRLRDTNEDDQFDNVEKLVEFKGDVGHGRNQLTLGPDGQVWGIFGDSVFEPESAIKVPPSIANPSPAEKERSGFVACFNADASEIKIVARGLRNPYGMDFNEHGDLFTYDADAEYDMGAPWYRPTRVLHVLPGGDYGWRRVTKQWPPYLPDRADMPQPTIDIGKGSPTAVAFGTRSKFPSRYRSALFILDWAYGRILAVNLTPRGASYQASAETFLRGQPLNVTDIEFGTDGALYFVTGGRGTQSALYRVTYVGPPADDKALTPQEQANDEHTKLARQTRRKLEAYLETPQACDLEELWPLLGSDDPWLRHAARAVLEKLPVETWKQRGIDEQDLNIALAARMALSRRGEGARWLSGRWSEANQRQRLELLYLAERTLTQSSMESAQSKSLVAELRSHYPADSFVVNQALSLILAEHPNDAFVANTMALLERSHSQPEQMLYLFVLRNVANGWTDAARENYFKHMRRMDDYVGGEGLPDFRKLVRGDALAALSLTDRAHYEKLLSSPPKAWVGELPPARTKLVRKWSTDELVAKWNASQAKGDPARGKSLFAAARCIVCHRAGDIGGVSGPDLTSVARRFAPRDVLQAIVEPSLAIDEKYADDVLELDDGRLITGRIAPGDYRSPELAIVPNLLEPEKAITVTKSGILKRTPSKISAMPSGLLDCFSEAEIFDLLSYLLAGERSSR